MIYLSRNLFFVFHIFKLSLAVKKTERQLKYMTHHASVFIKYHSLVTRSPSRRSLLVDYIYIHLHSPANTLMIMHTQRRGLTDDRWSQYWNEVDSLSTWRCASLSQRPCHVSLHEHCVCTGNFPHIRGIILPRTLNTISADRHYSMKQWHQLIPRLWTISGLLTILFTGKTCL